MRDDETGASGIIRGWWRQAMGMRESSAARALAARMRRATSVEALAEPAVHDLARGLGMRDGERLARVVRVLAHVRQDSDAPLAARLGGREPALSALRFQRLIRAEGEDLVTQLVRALPLADRTCHVGWLGANVLFWSEATRMRWCFAYFHTPAPKTLEEHAR
jgi:CRISPR system Cascade subunit CasB